MMLYISIVLLSALIVFIDIYDRSKSTPIRYYGTVPFFMYFLITAIGNTFAALILVYASGDVLSSSEGSDQNNLQKLLFRIPENVRWAIYAIAGVFGFQALITNFNISFAGSSFLNFNDWINKARDGAEASVIQKQIEKQEVEKQNVVNQLTKNPKEVLIIHLQSIVSETEFKRIDSAISSMQDESAKLYLSLALASKDISKAKGIAKNVG